MIRVAPRPSLAARVVRLIAIALMFAVLAPPIGALIWVALVAAISLTPDWGVPEDSRHLLTVLGLIYAVPMSYYVGAAPAASAGLVIGFTQAFIGRAGWTLALATALGAALLVLERSGQMSLLREPRESPFPEYPAIMILACLVPILLCWSLVRGWYFAPPAQSGAA
jgi:hypothetical protein